MSDAEESVNPILNGSVQNCTPIDYFKIFTKLLLAVNPIFFDF